VPGENDRTIAGEFRAAEIEYPAVTARAQLTVEISLASPLYGGGVEAGQLDVITPFRASGIRGNLRYWWRATKGSSFDTWEEMRDREAVVWGDTNKASSVRVDVQFPDNWANGRVPLRKYERDLNRKYALFPPYNQKGVNLDDVERQFLEAGTFTLTISVADREHRDDVEAALWAWVNFGGLGARTRRGAGALFCHPYAGWNAKFVAEGDGKLRPWPTLKGGTIVWGPAKKGSNAWADAWLDVLQLYREFRQDREGRGPTAWPEPDEIRAIRQNRGTPTKEGFPRGALGLPIVFHFKDPKRIDPPDQTLSVAAHSGGSKNLEPGRMTSPVILKPLAMARDLAYPMILVLNAPEAGQMYLFQQGAKTEPVTAGRRDGIAELILRAQQKWGGSTARI
jgi:CRISPR-associated protein Cmr1